MKNFKNNLSRNEMRAIFAGGGKGPAPIGAHCGADSRCSGRGGCIDSNDGQTWFCNSCCLA